jgi:hypothetical protein
MRSAIISLLGVVVFASCSAPAAQTPRDAALSAATPSATRPSVIELFPSPEANAVRVRLRSTQLKSFDLKDAKLAEAIEKIRVAGDFNVTVDWLGLKEMGIDGNTPIKLSLKDVSVADALSAVLADISGRTAQVAYTIDGNIVRILPKSVADERKVVRVYEISDIILAERARWAAIHPSPRPAEVPAQPPGVPLAAPPLPGGGLLPAPDQSSDNVDSFVEGIQKTVMDVIGTWRDKGNTDGGTLRVLNGRLVVEQTAEVHEQIERLLGVLRETAKVVEPGAPARP